MKLLPLKGEAGISVGLGEGQGRNKERRMWGALHLLQDSVLSDTFQFLPPFLAYPDSFQITVPLGPISDSLLKRDMDLPN